MTSSAKPRPEFLNPELVQPPAGEKLIVLTCEGICTISRWEPEARFCGWLPLPAVSSDIRELQRRLRGY